MNDPIRFILAGNAVITVENTATGNRFTFKVRKPDDTKPRFVSVLTGPNNENDYSFLGTVFTPERYGNERPSRHLLRRHRRPNSADKRGIRSSPEGGSEAMNVPLITYPARPIQGGRLELAPPKRGLWYEEPKLNGWRALIHTPTGTMWNRYGALLTIADCFRPALGALAKLASRGLVWADCEALERRHNLGRGTLVVLDVVQESGTPSYEQRRAVLESVLPCDPVFDGDTARPVPCGAVVLTPAHRADTHADVLAYYQRLRATNRTLGCDFFEGVVMKRADSIYPVQLRSMTEKCRGWTKHRFLR